MPANRANYDQTRRMGKERRVVIMNTLKPANHSPEDKFWDIHEEGVAVYVTNLEINEVKPAQITEKRNVGNASLRMLVAFHG